MSDGPYIRISLGEDYGIYQIVQIEGNAIYLHPVGDPSVISTIIQDYPDHWMVEGSDQEFVIETLESLPPDFVSTLPVEETPLEEAQEEVEEVPLGYPYPPISSWTEQQQLDLDRFLEEIGGTLLYYDLPLGLNYASNVFIPLTYVDQTGQTLASEVDPVEWFKYNYDRLGRRFGQDIFKAVTDPLLGQQGGDNASTLNDSAFADMFIPRPDEPEIMSVSEDESTFPEPPISQWTDQQKQDLAIILELLQHQGPSAVKSRIRQGTSTIPVDFIDNEGNPASVDTNFTLWFVHFFDLNGRSFAQQFYQIFSHYPMIQERLDESPVQQIFH